LTEINIDIITPLSPPSGVDDISPVSKSRIFICTHQIIELNLRLNFSLCEVASVNISFKYFFELSTWVTQWSGRELPFVSSSQRELIVVFKVDHWSFDSWSDWFLRFIRRTRATVFIGNFSQRGSLDRFFNFLSWVKSGNTLVAVVNRVFWIQ